MNDIAANNAADAVDKMKIETIEHPLLNSNQNRECEPAEEAVTTDSEEYLSEPLRYRNFQSSTQSNNSDVTLIAQRTVPEENANIYSFNSNDIQIPIVGYEIMEERARFTVYKLRIENKVTGDCWYVFRRYTDFVRLCNRLKTTYPQVVQHLPRKRWLKNNFDPMFLDDRVNGLQTLVNAIINLPELMGLHEVQDFFCLNEPPMYWEANEESRAMFQALEETISELKQQLREREAKVDSLQEKLHSKVIENDNLKKLIRSSTLHCQKCLKDSEENVTKVVK